MSQWSLLKRICLTHLSQPAADRPVYRAIYRNQVHSIVELGVGSGRRTQRMIRLANEIAPDEVIRYAGVDLFEARPQGQPQLKLKAAYMEFKRLTASVQLAPGDPFSALARIANSLRGTDLLVIAADQDPEAMARAWSYVPRMLHRDSVVLREESGSGMRRTRFVQVRLAEVERLAQAALRFSRVAA
jgi:hypothetical protein